MSRETIPVRNYMTACPVSITVNETLARAGEIMREHSIRHLPVASGNQLVGLLTDRDLQIVEALELDPRTILVDDAMTTDVYSIAANTPLEDVAAEMARRKVSSAVVDEGGAIAGVFTTVDACRALSELIRARVFFVASDAPGEDS